MDQAILWKIRSLADKVLMSRLFLLAMLSTGALTFGCGGNDFSAGSDGARENAGGKEEVQGAEISVVTAIG